MKHLHNKMDHIVIGQVHNSSEIIEGDVPISVTVHSEGLSYLMAPDNPKLPVTRPALLHSEDMREAFEGASISGSALIEAKRAYISGVEFIKRNEVRDRAKAEFDKVLALIPNHPWSLMHCGQLLVLEGKYTNAVTCFQNLTKRLKSNDEFHFNFGNALFGVGDHAGAAREWKKTLCANPLYAEAMNNLGVVFASKGKAAQAKAMFHSALKLFPDYGDAALNHLRVTRLGNKSLYLRITWRNIATC